MHYPLHESNFSWILIMNKKILRTSILLTLAITWMLAFSLPILADKSSSNGNRGIVRNTTRKIRASKKEMVTAIHMRKTAMLATSILMNSSVMS